MEYNVNISAKKGKKNTQMFKESLFFNEINRLTFYLFFLYTGLILPADESEGGR